MESTIDLNPTGSDVLTLTAQIIAAHLSGNPTTPEVVPSLIRNVYRVLSTMGQVEAVPARCGNRRI